MAPGRQGRSGGRYRGGWGAGLWIPDTAIFGQALHRQARASDLRHQLGPGGASGAGWASEGRARPAERGLGISPREGPEAPWPGQPLPYEPTQAIHTDSAPQ